MATYAGKEIASIRAGFGEKLGFAVWTSTIVVCSLIIGFSVAARITGFLFSIVPILVALFALLGWLTEKVGAPSLRIEGKMSNFVEEIMGSMRVVQAFGMNRALLDRFDSDMLKPLVKFGMRKALIRGSEAGVVYLALFATYSAAFWFIALNIVQGHVELGDGLTAFWNLVNSLFAFSSAVPQISSLFEALGAIRHLRKVIETPPKIDVRDQSGEKPDEKDAEPSFELQHVTFAYPARPNIASLDDVSVLLEPGKVTALVGPSGSGKSTITSLLLREYDPETANVPLPGEEVEEREDEEASKKLDGSEKGKGAKDELNDDVEKATSKVKQRVQGQGRVLYAGRDVRNLNLRWLRSQVAIVRQNPQIFTATVFENVATGLSGTKWAYKPEIDGSPDADEATKKRTEVIRQKAKDALVKAQAWDFVSRLPEGMDTKVSGGKTGLLSGGQRQRLCLARALIRSPRILVIDEGTSAIDSSTEERIRLMLEEEHRHRGMTTCLIAHRLSTIEHADKIIVMKSGAVVDQGTHTELMDATRTDHTYRDMVVQQRAIVEVEEAERTSDRQAHEELLSDGGTTRVAESTLGAPGPASGGRRRGGEQQSPTHFLQRKTSRASEHSAWQVPLRSISSVNHSAAGAAGAGGVSATAAGEEEAPVNEKRSSEVGVGAAKVEEDEGKKMTSLAVWPKFVRTLAPEKWEFFAGIVGALLAGGIFPLIGWITGKAVDSLNEPEPSKLRSGTNLWSLVFLIIAFADFFLTTTQSFFLEAGSEKMSRRLKRRALESLMRQEIGFFDKPDQASGALAAAVVTHPSNMASATGLVFSQVLISFANLLGSVILAFVLDWRMAFACLSPVVVLLFTGWLNVAMLQKYETSLQEPSNRASSYLGENIDGIKELTALGREADTLRAFETISKPRSVRSQWRALVMGAGGFSISQASVLAVAALVFFYGGKLYAQDELSRTNLYAVFEAVIIAVFGSARLLTFTGDFGRAAASFATLSSWFERKPRIAGAPPLALVGARDAGHKGDDDDAACSSPSPPCWSEQDIHFENVELRYPQRMSYPAIRDLNLTLYAGKTQAFCGTSGSGKSTILQMVQRFYDPARGTIRMGGEKQGEGSDIRSIPLDELRSQMSYVSQDACLYEGSIRFNLLLGAVEGRESEVTQEHLEACCEDACIADFIRGLPDGYETTIGAKGHQLSGGQRQRICIARALVRKPKILLLDEATSALDAQAEVSVQKALDNAAKGRTTLTVAHRLSTIRNSYIIHVVEDGAIVESGSHAELIARGGRYLELIGAQI